MNATSQRRNTIWSIFIALVPLGVWVDVALFLFNSGLRNPLQAIPMVVRVGLLVPITGGIAWMGVQFVSNTLAYLRRFDELEDEAERTQEWIASLRQRLERDEPDTD